jgi:hypothetical protein
VSLLVQHCSEGALLANTWSLDVPGVQNPSNFVLLQWCCRPIELPNGWPVNEFPIICGGMNELYEELFGPRRML